MARPLNSIRILELGGFISGPFAGQVLAEFGAEVIKVEPPNGGDPFRTFDGSDYSPQFVAYNAGKKSVALDLKALDGRRRFLDLVSTSHAILDNFRPGVLDKLGLTRIVLERARPDLIHCSITGFGTIGPYSARPAYDTVATAMSGLMSQFVDRKRPLIAGPAIADPISGFYAALGIMAALVERESGARGFRRVEISMMDALVSFNGEPFGRYFASGRDPGPYERAAFSQSYALPCADGKHVALHLSSPPKFWAGLLAAIERPDLADEPRFKDRLDRIENFEALTTELAETFRRRPQSEWLERLASAGVPHAPVYELSDVTTDPHATAVGTFIELEHPVHGRVRHVAAPVLFDGERTRTELAPPVLGEHDALV